MNIVPKTPKLLVKEIFYSIQGESSLAGYPFIFIRLSGCNLRCGYCDSAYAFKGGSLMSFDEILQAI
jgi:7-carboxy-7-deazaguanine synthase